MTQDQYHHHGDLDDVTILKARAYSPTMPDPQADEPWIDGLSPKTKDDILECIHYIHQLQKQRQDILTALDAPLDNDTARHLTITRIRLQASIVGLQDVVMNARLFPEYN